MHRVGEPLERGLQFPLTLAGGVQLARAGRAHRGGRVAGLGGGVPVAAELFELGPALGELVDLGPAPEVSEMRARLDALEADTEMREVFGEQFVATFLAYKRNEIERFNSFITDWEFREYTYHL